ncbi:MAG: hypothetical protein Q8S33_22050 [Myxococcales bacterium]|nr:hypothetical protein [Myxococcales bacterium]MDP3503032.1 hypothetical protein [Myxococcales bacterium]
MRVFALALLVATSALAQGSPEREVELVKAVFDAGKYSETVALVRKALSVTNFTDGQRIELHRMAGLSSFNLGDTASAKESFVSLLRLNPDHVLDPFIAPPPAIRLFEAVRKENADELGLVRQLMQVRAEQERRAAEERKKLDLERATRRVVTIERRPMWMNFLPFGAGQFLQDRTEWGVAFAISEGVFAITSIVAYWAIEGLKVRLEETIADTNTASGFYTLVRRGIPATATAQRDSWNIVKWTTGGAFYLAYALGVVDALVHHTGDRVKETREQPQALRPRFEISPLPGGVYAGVTLSF